MVRGSRQGESHGGVYLIDFAADRSVRMLDWNAMSIDWQGRGWDRGLRGIEFDGETVYIAASDELFAYTPDFELVGSWRNPYLKHCHEISRYERTLFMTSTGFDSIVGFNLDERAFSFGMHVTQADGRFAVRHYDPLFDEGPLPSNQLHLNTVFCAPGGMHVSGLRTGGVLLYNGSEIRRWVSLPHGTHNARPFRDGVLFNDTESDVVRFTTRTLERVFRVPRYPPEKLTHADLDDSRIARQAFGRGLCTIDDDTIACGSSPSTVTVHSLVGAQPSRSATLSYDIRNAIHGLEVWPYGWREPRAGGRLPDMGSRP